MNFVTKYGPILVTVAGTIGVAVFTPQFITAHPQAFAVLALGTQVLHAALPSVFPAAK